jgi:hypothetical protein
MRSRVRLVISLALALVFTFATARHDEHLGSAALGVGSLQHRHGPFGACPEAHEHHCLACAAAHVVPTPTVSHIESLPARRSETKSADAYESIPSLLIRSGRSPPASSRAA